MSIYVLPKILSSPGEGGRLNQETARMCLREELGRWWCSLFDCIEMSLFLRLNFIALFPIAKCFIFGVENLEETDKHFEDGKTPSVHLAPRAV